MFLGQHYWPNDFLAEINFLLLFIMYQTIPTVTISINRKTGVFDTSLKK